MTSVLNVDTIAAKNGTDPVTLTKQSAAKAWANYNGSSTASIIDSFNASSLSDGGTGDYTHDFINSMANGTYTLGGACHDAAGNFGIYTTIKGSGLTTGTCQTYIMNHANVVRDPDIGTFAIHGDLA
jgi:hypothetical protein